MDSLDGYLGILKWSLGYTDGTAPSATHLSDADKEWLKEAFAALTVDEAKTMKTQLAILREPDTEEAVGAKMAAFEELEFLVESIDNSKGTGFR